MDSVGYPEWTPRSALRQQRRIDRSMIIERVRSSTKLEGTHKDKDPIGVRFPVLYHLLILFGRHFQVHGENMSGAVRIIGHAGSCLIRR